jgi:hypothetical protein
MSKTDAPPPASDRSGGANTRPLWLAVGVLLAVGILLPLMVGIYDQESPALWGFPFFYWFQFMLIPVTAVVTYTAFRISQTATRRERAARGLPGPAENGESR